MNKLLVASVSLMFTLQACTSCVTSRENFRVHLSVDSDPIFCHFLFFSVLTIFLLRGQVLPGSQSFVEELQPHLDGMLTQKEIPLAQRRARRPGLRGLFPARVCADKRVRDRDEVVRQAYLEHGYSMAAIAGQAGLHYSTVSKIIKGER